MIKGSGSSDSGTLHNRWEAFIERDYPDVHKSYIHFKRLSKNTCEDPIRRFRNEIQKACGEELAMKFWHCAVAKRIVSHDINDEEFLRLALSMHNLDINALASTFDDTKDFADFIRALKLPQLMNMPYDAYYQIVDKLISVKGCACGRLDGIGSVFDAVPAGEIDDNPEAIDILVKTDITRHQPSFEKDYKQAESDLQEKADKEDNPLRKLGFVRVLKFFQELKAERIPGVVSSFTDYRGREVEFPAEYQKLAAKFIADKKRTLIADDMGIGKTAEAIVAKNLIDARAGRLGCAVALVPKTLIDNGHWVEQINMWNEPMSRLRAPERGLTADERKKAESDFHSLEDHELVAYYLAVAKENGFVFRSQVEGNMQELAAEIEQRRLGHLAYKSATVATISAKSTEEDLKAIIANPPEFIVVNYNMIYKKRNGSTVAEMLAPICDYLIADEVHNAKKENGRRTQALLHMSKKAPFVAMLSGTPVPNRPKDLGVVASILNNHDLTPREFNKRYAANPGIMRVMVHPRMLRRKREKTIGLGDCTVHPPVRIPMTKEQQIAHERILMSNRKLMFSCESPDQIREEFKKIKRLFNDKQFEKLRNQELEKIRIKDERGNVYFVKKNNGKLDVYRLKGALEIIIELRKCALDPRLVGLDLDSPKYARLLQMLNETRDRAQGKPRPKAVIFSSELKEGVLDPICELLSKNGYMVARVDGDVTGDKRKEQLEWFSGKKKIDGEEADVLVATLDTLGEGVDLTCASSCYFIDLPFNDAALRQGIARLDRKGQDKHVDVYKLVSENSIDEMLLRMMAQKKKLEQYLLDGLELTRLEKKILARGERMVASGSMLRKLIIFFGSITNKDSEDVVERIRRDRKLMTIIAEEYWKNFEGSFFGNTNNQLKEIIEAAEGIGRKFSRILDLSSGPCCLSRTLKRPVISVDINDEALKLGRRKLHDSGLESGPALCSSFSNLPFRAGSFDMVVFSLAILHTAYYEREGILREVNRVMMKDGMLLITMPSGDERFEMLQKGLSELGFEIVPEVTGTGRDAETNRFECQVVCAIKRAECPEKRLPEDLLDFYSDLMTGEDSLSSTRKERFERFKIDTATTAEAVKDAEALYGVNPEVLAVLKAKYGDTEGIHKKCPKPELRSLGLVSYKEGTKFRLTTVEQYAMIQAHREFVRKLKKENVGAASGKKVAA